MLKHLRRWHFDVALFVGLGLFAWAYWYSVPRPSYLGPVIDRKSSITLQHQMINISADDQVLYCLNESKADVNSRSKPSIEKWSTQTGELQETIPLQIPEEERKADEGQTIEVYSPSIIKVTRTTGKGERFHRFYNGVDGQAIGPAIAGKSYQEMFHLLAQPARDGHLWAIQDFVGVILPTYLIDLTTGKTVRTFERTATEKASNGFLTPGGEYYLQTWRKTTGGKSEFEVFSTNNWESLGRFRISANMINGVQCLDASSWAFTELFRPDPAINALHYRLRFFRFDPAKKTLTPDPLHAFDGVQSKGPFILEPPYLVKWHTTEPPRPQSRVLQTIEDWLGRIGIHRDYSQKTSFTIYDLATGQPLRQISGLPASGFLKSHDQRYLFCFRSPENASNDPSKQRVEYVLCRYQIPHYLWEPTLSWIQWLSWLLVIQWPLRYFVPSFSPRLSK